MKEGDAVLQKGWSKIGILLGGGITKRGKLPHDPKTRAEKAYKLLKEGYIDSLILSGGGSLKKKNLTEADSYFDYLAEKGIPKRKLILEKESHDTIGNAVYCKKIFLKKKIAQKNIVLITSDYHIKRALKIFSHIFGEKYSFVGVSSRPFIVHKIALTIREFLCNKVDDFILSKFKSGEHKKAERLIKKYLPMYEHKDKEDIRITKNKK